ncbi:hypothetical protein ACFOKI_08990 [Sphingomonas qilianensis]|uniref:Uncharacterized protein n=1 Tax=Sphingomonas qilianensis TaxID=1736690 RepID=A0ABU9XSR2_9SPHN
MSESLPVAPLLIDPPASNLSLSRATKRRAIVIDLIVAVLLGVMLSTAWAANDWSKLRWLALPDTDDMMRLAQVRDWLNGQAFNNWTQYRLAPPHGVPMHWSRINDLGLAAIILAATPLVGRHQAELIAVLAYPGLLFIISIFLSARIARHLWSPEAATVAAVLAALAVPGTNLFVPGRIDHHALQTVMIELAVLAMVRGPSLRNGLAAGVALAISLVIGLETAPHVATLIAVAGLIWVACGITERRRLAGLASGMAAATLFSLAFLRPSYWSAALCDAFTPASASTALLVSVALGALAQATPYLRDWRWRFGMAVILASGAAGIVLIAFPTCLAGPYGAMDPFLQREFLAHITEAQGLLKQRPQVYSIGLGGLLMAGFSTTIWMLWRSPRIWPLLAPPAAIVIVSASITLFQVRGTYIGTLLCAPILAGLVLAARRREHGRAAALIGAWLVSAGILYGFVSATLLASKSSTVEKSASLGGECKTGDVWHQIGLYPNGVILAAADLAPYLIGGTEMATVGAGYHRNNDGIMDTYRYFLHTPKQGRPIAAKWQAKYVAFCPGDFDEMKAYTHYPTSLATLLHQNRPPPWLKRLPLRGTSLRLYRITQH